LQEAELAREGEIVTYTVVRQGPANWKGPMPYIIVQVKLDDGPKVETQLAESADTQIIIGSKVELILDKLKEDQEGNEIMVHKFRLKERR
jgi:uncharacterized OB-fold protein